jgi:hypothetical protein
MTLGVHKRERRLVEVLCAAALRSTFCSFAWPSQDFASYNAAARCCAPSVACLSWHDQPGGRSGECVRHAGRTVCVRAHRVLVLFGILPAAMAYSERYGNTTLTQVQVTTSHPKRAVLHACARRCAATQQHARASHDRNAVFAFRCALFCIAWACVCCNPIVAGLHDLDTTHKVFAHNSDDALSSYAL